MCVCVLEHIWFQLDSLKILVLKKLKFKEETRVPVPVPVGIIYDTDSVYYTVLECNNISIISV